MSMLVILVLIPQVRLVTVCRTMSHQHHYHVLETDLTCLFEQHGTVQEVKLQSDRGYAFVK